MKWWAREGLQTGGLMRQAFEMVALLLLIWMETLGQFEWLGVLRMRGERRGRNSFWMDKGNASPGSCVWVPQNFVFSAVASHKKKESISV
ncbi:hypothetical protein IWZ01DRAFT_516332 [Phyllosticta capitalensis]